MKQRILILFVLALFVVSLSGLAHAEGFTVLADTGILNLKDDQAWEKIYKTDYGKFKVRFRKLWNSSAKKRFHLIIWQNDKRIADGYCPKNDSGYSFHIYQENESGRIFVALESVLRVVLMGYEPMNGRLEKYVDSKEYYSSGSYPKLHLHRDGHLHLTFSDERWRPCNDYQMIWDEDSRWFGYRDLMAPVATPSYEEEEEEPYYGEPSIEAETDAETTPSSQPAAKPDSFVMEDEMYYTEATSKT